MDQLENKQIVTEMYRVLIRDRNFAFIDKYIDDNYIQHSPSVKDGKDGLLSALSFLGSLPKSLDAASSRIVRMIAEGDMVMAHLDIKFGGKQIAVVDIFKLKDKKIIEHWSVEQEVPVDMPHNNGMF